MPTRHPLANATLLSATALLVSACGNTGPADEMRASTAAEEIAPAAAAENSALQAVRSATDKYRDVEVALAEGYIPDPTNMCVTAPMEGLPSQLGNMGIHYFRPDLLGITETQPRIDGNGTHTDFQRPGVLIYEPQPDGSLELVAVENLVFEAPWKAAGNEGAPSFQGLEYYHMIDNPRTPDVDEAHGFEPHYELHLWLYRDNPAGVGSQFNPRATCEHHRMGGQA